MQSSALRFSMGSNKLTVQKNVKLRMEKLLDDRLLVNYSALGIRGKKTFSEYRGVAELIWFAVSQTFKDKSFDDIVKDMVPKMGTYLKHAKKRLDLAGGSKKADAAADDLINKLIPVVQKTFLKRFYYISTIKIVFNLMIIVFY